MDSDLYVDSDLHYNSPTTNHPTLYQCLNVSVLPNPNKNKTKQTTKKCALMIFHFKITYLKLCQQFVLFLIRELFVSFIIPCTVPLDKFIVVIICTFHAAQYQALALALWQVKSIQADMSSDPAQISPSKIIFCSFRKLRWRLRDFEAYWKVPEEGQRKWESWRQKMGSCTRQ